jgi:hypothetical protein
MGRVPSWNYRETMTRDGREDGMSDVLFAIADAIYEE